MEVPVIVQVRRGDDLIYEKIGNETGENNLEKLRKCSEQVQKDLNTFLTKLVEEERKTGSIERTKDGSSDSDEVSDEDADEDLDNLLKRICGKPTR